ncbi:Uncharacterized protein SCF082_LOCUS35726, partial [Durusdinium trenchii]
MGKGNPPFRLWSHGRALRHRGLCKAEGRCHKCWWAQHGPKWKRKFPWLRFGQGVAEDVDFGFGCSVCVFDHLVSNGAILGNAKRRPVATPCRTRCVDTLDHFSLFSVRRRLKADTLKRHHDSQKHQEAQRFLPGHITEDDLTAAPSLQDFASALRNMRNGQSMRNGSAPSDTTSLLHWCISESLLQFWRSKLSEATTLCLVRDERKGKMLIRFRGCSASLELCCGTLGCQRMTGGSAEDIVTATAKALRIFCTEMYHPPRMGRRLSQQGGFNRMLFNHMRSIVHILTTDSHPAELLASNIMKGDRQSADEQHNRDPFLPNVVLVGRDAAHASTRLEVFAETIRNKDSPVQKIFNSNIFSRWFEEAVLHHGGAPQATSLSAAKHRFASYAKPLGRITLHLETFFRLLHRIASMRDDADWARKWLANISCHKLLLLALAADGADSLMQLCRFLDAENTDPAALNQEIGHFLDELHALFRLGKAWEVEGYSKH